jgi:hypothetical protein
MGRKALTPLIGGRTSLSVECLATYFIINGYISERIVNAMSVKKNVKQSSNGKVDWKGSYNYYLTSADKTGIKKLSVKSEDVLARWRELMDRGYKCSATADTLERFYTVTAFANQDHVPNAGYSLSLRHSDFFVAVNAVWFVVAEKYNWEMWEDVGQEELPFSW